EDFLAFLQLVVDCNGAAPGGRVTQHADHVAVLLGSIVAQRVLPQQTGAHFHIDMRPGAEGRQAAAIQCCQLKGDDIQSRRGLACNSYFEYVGIHNSVRYCATAVFCSSRVRMSARNWSLRTLPEAV